MAIYSKTNIHLAPTSFSDIYEQFSCDLTMTIDCAYHEYRFK